MEKKLKPDFLLWRHFTEHLLCNGHGGCWSNWGGGAWSRGGVGLS
uniref:Uncharacterized protein n=1 Tax=Setaria italica TaxID=4555 RepID=K3Y4K5_SETIT